MRGFTGRFRQFYTNEGITLLKNPSSTALFRREVINLFERFKQYLHSKNQSPKGLKMKDFEKILEDEGFVLVTNRK